MKLYKQPGSSVYSYKFMFNGALIRKSTGTRDKKLADQIMRERKRELEIGGASLPETNVAVSFSTAAADWLALRKSKVAAMALGANTVRIDETNLEKLLPVFGTTLVPKITSAEVAAYQASRLRAMVAPKTVNLELGTLRGIIKRHGCWEKISLDVGLSKVPDSIGRVIPAHEQEVLFAACQMSRSRQLYTIVMLAFQTGVRFGPLKTVRWRNIDFVGRSIQWGKDKTPAGSGRIIPLNARALEVLQAWALLFPDRKPQDFVFPSERCGAAGHHFGSAVSIHYDTDPSTPIGSVETAWSEAKKRCGIKCRFHDIRHTAVTAMVNGGWPLPKIAKIVGWSPSQTVRMSLIYSHFTLDDLRGAMDSLDARTPVEGQFLIVN